MTYLDNKFDLIKPINNTNLIRVGSKKDGGYIVDKKIILNSNQLLSYGMGLDWSFELEYLNLNKKGSVDIYDHTINIFTFLKPFLKYLKRFLTFRLSYKNLILRFELLREYINFIFNKKISFYKKKISNSKKIKSVQVNQTFNQLKTFKNIIFKIDIEGSEFEIIEDVITYNENIEMLIMEFHQLDIRENEFLDIVKKINNYFHVIHVHGNNHCGISKNGLPIALEITFLNNKYKPAKIEYKKEFPDLSLDFPNNPEKNDLFFSFK